MDDICYFKLVSGEDLVAKIVSEDDRSYTIKNSVIVHIVPTEQGASVQMMPFPLVSTLGSTSILNKNGIVLTSEPSVDFINAYNERFGSGIQVASPELARTILHS